MIQPPDPKWHSRGYLPHVESPHQVQHITFHLADSLPKHAIEQIELELDGLPPGKRSLERRKRLEAWIDAGHGVCILREPAIAQMTQNALLFFDGERYHLIAWVVMPNRVHAMIEPTDGWQVGKTVASWKRFMAAKIRGYLNDANSEIGGPGGPIWHREYWDRYARNEFHLREMIEYVRQNPVAAGLVKTAEDWPWSSARSLAILNID
jgi:REP element-mobilizing transposase RayT